MELITLDPVTKQLSVPESALSQFSAADQSDLKTEVEQLQLLFSQLVTANVNIPAAPNQLNGVLLKQVDKMRDSALRELKAGRVVEAARQFGLALDMALRRPGWEGSQHQIQMVASLLDSRCQAYVEANMWPEAFGDASVLVNIQPTEWKHWYRKGLCLRKVKRYTEALGCLRSAAEMAAKDQQASVKINNEIESIEDLAQ